MGIVRRSSGKVGPSQIFGKSKRSTSVTENRIQAKKLSVRFRSKFVIILVHPTKIQKNGKKSSIQDIAESQYLKADCEETEVEVEVKTVLQEATDLPLQAVDSKDHHQYQ